MLSEISGLFELFPFDSLYQGRRRKRMEEQWACAHVNFSLKSALNAIFLSSLFLFFLSFLISFILFSDIFLSLGSAFVFFALCLLFGFRFPLFMAKRYAQELESDLPLALRAISLHLKINLPFEKALEHIANSNYGSSLLFKEALLLAKSGISIPLSLSKSASNAKSLPFSRAMHQLTLIYSEGSSPETLDYLADELISEQLASTRLQASRAAIFGLLFVAISSLLPAFFLILNISAGPFIGFETNSLSIWLFYLIALPLANSIVLSLMLALSPSLLGSQKQKSISFQAGELASKSGFPKLGTKKMIFLSLFLFLSSIILLTLFGFSQIAFLAGFILASIPWAISAYFESQIISSLSSLEAELPNVLLAGASSSRFSLEAMLENASSCPSLKLAEQSSAALRQINAGSNPLKVLSEWSARTPSSMLSRALTLLSIGYQSGGKLQKAFRSSAEDLMASFSLVRERASLLSIQNYTLMAAAGILVPAILAISLSFSFQVSQMQEGVGMANILNLEKGDSAMASNSNSAQLIHAAQASIPIYLIINSILVSLFISFSQGAREKFIYYAILLSLCSQITWIVAGGFGT